MKNRTMVLALTAYLILSSSYQVLASECLMATLLVPHTVPQGEPLAVTIQVKNISKEYCYILVPIIRRFGPDTVMFDVQAPDFKQEQSVQRPDIYVGGFKSMAPLELPVKKIAPGEVTEYSFSLIYDFPDVESRKLLFKVSGRYAVRASVFELADSPGDVSEVPYNVRRCEIQTGSVNVEIIPPESQREKDALQALWGLPDEYLVYAPFAFQSDCHAEAATKMKEYYGNYSDTEFGQRVALVLGVAIAKGVVSDDSGDIRKAIESLSLNKQLPLHTVASAVLEEMANRKRQ